MVSVLSRAATVLGLALASVGLGLVAFGALHRLIVRAPTGWAGTAGLELLALGVVFITLGAMLSRRARALLSSTCRRATQALGRIRLHVLSVPPRLIALWHSMYTRAAQALGRTQLHVLSVLPGLIPSWRSTHKRAGRSKGGLSRRNAQLALDGKLAIRTRHDWAIFCIVVRAVPLLCVQ